MRRRRFLAAGLAAAVAPLIPRWFSRATPVSVGVETATLPEADDALKVMEAFNRACGGHLKCRCVPLPAGIRYVTIKGTVTI